ncbi:SpaA isopeptide-forming pilin-related protein [Aristaeella lactis]|uniref:SpaA isopeptide-forming pilin-related protein n=1 Tax=Aristaeella lactis TaxID=3046383 RepID=UPI001BB62826|nr:SpaA isopeptide-forming pilin-related protein [Aristaeella lactis]QUA54479.1 hypothetical protein JYE50_07795 [Aristaeella lactis]
MDETGKVTVVGARTVDENGKTVILVEDAKTHVEVKKTDIANGKEVAGAKLVVLDKDDKEFDSWTSTENGNHIIEGLKTGEENVYTLRETVAPEGYTVVTDIKFWVDETGKVTVVGARTVDENGKTVILVEDAKTHVEVKKTDIANGKEVEGAKLVVLDKDDKEFDSWTSTENGNHIIEGLKTGEENVYTLRETVAPEGYTVVTDIKFWVDETGKVTVVGARTVDENGKTVILVEDAKTHVEVKKTDIANGKEVEGAKLVVLDKDDKEFDSWTSTENGNHIIEGLKTGEENVYTLRETVAPEGYTVVTDIKFWVDETGKVTVVGAKTVDENGKTVILVEDAKTHVEVKKTDIANGKEVAGAKLVVLDKDDKEFDSWTSTENGNHIIEGLKTGEENVYTLRETVAPEGYTVVTDIKFWVDETGKVTVVGARTVDENGKTVILVEDAKTHVEVKKTDIANGKEVEGAKLVVLDKDDKEFDSWTSTENGNHIIEGLKTGEENVYTLRETVAPEGYTVVTDIKFWVDETGKVTVVGARTVDENGKTVILVEDAKTHVEVKKTDIANGKEVAGAKLVVLDKDDKEFDSWTSTENGNHIIEGLKTGEENVYTLRETVAPEGYTVVTDIKFWVDETGKVTVVGARTVDENGKTVILVEDAKTHVEVKKTDIANGKEVEGAKLVVLDKDDKEFDSWTSTENGNHIIEGLKTGEENVYTLRETVAPEGYTVVTDIKFWVDETGKVTVVGARTVDENGKTVILVEDAKTHVEVKKTDIANGKEVEGAKLVVLDKDDKEFDSWTSTENGNHIIEGLKTGEENVYTLRETVAPEGYTVVTDIKFWVDETGKVTVVGAKTVDENGKTVILVEDAKTHVEVKKTDIANGKEVAGAKLVVLDKDDKEFDSWTSTENGNHIIEGLKTGEENVYTLRETVAPEGYTVVTDIKFWVDETGKVTVVGARTVDENGKTVILVEDAKTHVEVKKTDIANGKEVERREAGRSGQGRQGIRFLDQHRERQPHHRRPEDRRRKRIHTA